jgi:peroxiredoxin
MNTSILLLAVALTTGQPAERADWQLSPRLTPGLELVYSGVYVDESLIPNAQHQRQYRLDTHLLVLDAGAKDWHVAMMTGLSLNDAKAPGDKKPLGPTSIRLEQGRVDWQGRMRTLEKKLVEIPIDGPATLEFGYFVPTPITKVGKNFSWDTSDTGLPSQRWQVVGTEACGGFTCIKLTGVKQSDDWERGRADKAAWRRRDTIWLHPQLYVAQKVERIIELRDAARETPTHRHMVRYELDGHLVYPTRLFEACKDDVAKATKFQADAQALVRQPVLNRGMTDSLLQRVSYHLDHQKIPQPTPYRKAVLHVKSVLERAKLGDAPAPVAPEQPAVVSVKTLELGQRVPDFAVSSLTAEKTTQLKHLQGKPFLVFFYNPATPLGREVLAYAKTLNDQHADQLAILAMAVTQDVDFVRKQHEEMRLAFPIHDGNGLRLTFGAAETPRFLLVDHAGVVRLTQTGWGYHMPYEIADLLQRFPKK